MSLAGLFSLFMYIGTFTIGGGLVGISLMQQEIVARGLISPERFYNMVAISESTPGPIGINMATYIGVELYGIPGALITTFGTVIPSLVVILAIARWFPKFQERKIVKNVFYGLRAGSTGMIAVAAFQVLGIAIFDQTGYARYASLGLFTVLFGLNLKFDWHPLVFVLAGALFGMVFL